MNQMQMVQINNRFKSLCGGICFFRKEFCLHTKKEIFILEDIDGRQWVGESLEEIESLLLSEAEKNLPYADRRIREIFGKDGLCCT